MVTVKHIAAARDSAEYAELVAEVFAETVAKAAGNAVCSDSAGEEISAALMDCLQYVYLHGPSPIRQIAVGLEVSLSAASQLVDRLVKRALVTRHEIESDRRLISVELTDAGRDAVTQMRAQRSVWFEQIIGAMPDDKRVAFLEGLEGFLKVALAKSGDTDKSCDRCGSEHVPFCVVSTIRDEQAKQAMSDEQRDGDIPNA